MLSSPWRIELEQSQRSDVSKKETRVPRELFDYSNGFERVSNGKVFALKYLRNV